MKEISENSKKRLLILSRLLSQQTQTRLTSLKIAELTGWSDTTIRKDLSLLGLHFGVSNGYDVKSLKQGIDSALGFNLPLIKQNVCIVGLSEIGQALLNPIFFGKTPFSLVAGFDTNQNRLDLIKTKIPLFPTLDLETKIRQLNINFALLAVADEKAQFMAERLVNYGIKAIINYTNTVLSLPKNIKLTNASPSALLSKIAF
ncbi:CoA-binding protein [Treponema pectinovorum]|uniref:CoA-binding protein n=1 Tax=Treponema pectinovorum TaxID=164 RepID=UPI003D89D71C